MWSILAAAIITPCVALVMARSQEDYRVENREVGAVSTFTAFYGFSGYCSTIINQMRANAVAASVTSWSGYSTASSLSSNFRFRTSLDSSDGYGFFSETTSLPDWRNDPASGSTGTSSGSGGTGCYTSSGVTLCPTSSSGTTTGSSSSSYFVGHHPLTAWGYFIGRVASLYNTTTTTSSKARLIYFYSAAAGNLTNSRIFAWRDYLAKHERLGTVGVIYKSNGTWLMKSGASRHLTNVSGRQVIQPSISSLTVLQTFGSSVGLPFNDAGDDINSAFDLAAAGSNGAILDADGKSLMVAMVLPENPQSLNSLQFCQGGD